MHKLTHISQSRILHCTKSNYSCTLHTPLWSCTMKQWSTLKQKNTYNDSSWTSQNFVWYRTECPCSRERPFLKATTKRWRIASSFGSHCWEPLLEWPPLSPCPFWKLTVHAKIFLPLRYLGKNPFLSHFLKRIKLRVIIKHSNEMLKPHNPLKFMHFICKRLKSTEKYVKLNFPTFFNCFHGKILKIKLCKFSWIWLHRKVREIEFSHFLQSWFHEKFLNKLSHATLWKLRNHSVEIMEF